MIGIRRDSLQRAMQIIAVFVLAPLTACPGRAQSKVDFGEQVAPLLKKYCIGCHNNEDQEGDLLLEMLLAGKLPETEQPLLVPGKPDASRLYRVVIGKQEPTMPPEGEPAPTPQEIEILKQWIAAGAALNGVADPLLAFKPLAVPPAPAKYHQIGSAVMVGNQLAIGRLGRIDLIDPATGNTTTLRDSLPGDVTALCASSDQRYLLAGVSVPGVGGEVLLLDAATGKTQQVFRGHGDAIYAVALSPDGMLAASGGYDRKVMVWDVRTGQARHELTGHNGPIYDLCFDPSSRVLASASGDQTIKIWQVATGQRLDTFSQAEGEMTSVRFSPDGRTVFGGGYDRQIRQWKLLSVDHPEVNPMLVARYAHEAPVLAIENAGEEFLVSISEDHTVKLWDARQLLPLGTLLKTDELPVAIAVATNGQSVMVVDLVGKRYAMPTDDWDQRLEQARARWRSSRQPTARPPEVTAQATQQPTTIDEVEPNDTPESAQVVSFPAQIHGTIFRPDTAARSAGDADVDLYRFKANAGDVWIFEVDARRSKSPLDSRIDVLYADGKPVLRTRLQAVHESYFTFRGKDADTSDDFRLHKWEEMELDEYLYSSGEVTRLWHYPRGPDSGFKVYPGFGARYTYFDTTPIAHALGEPAYIVRPLAAGEAPLPNGLPVFPIYFENDDDPLRRIGRDSRLTFVAPSDGEYCVRVRDARGFGGENYHYTLHVRRPAPDFRLKLAGTNMQMPVGSGREWSVTAERIDGFEGPITIELRGLPEGFEATDPLVIEAGQVRAFGCVFATPKAEARFSDEVKSLEVELVAKAMIGDQEVERPLPQKLVLSLTDQPELQVRLYTAEDRNEELRTLRIAPGQTVSAVVVVQRNGVKSRVEFGKDDAGRNLPHGAYVDNIGLNGLLITENSDSREFFITAAPKTPIGRRQFHLRANTKGNPTSPPVWLEVVPAGGQAEPLAER